MLQEQEQEEAEEDAQKCDKKMRGTMVARCGMTTKQHCALHLRAPAGHMNNTNAPITSMYRTRR